MVWHLAAVSSLLHCVGLCGASPPGAVCGSRVQVRGPHAHPFHRVLCFLVQGFSVSTPLVSASGSTPSTLGGELFGRGRPVRCVRLSSLPGLPLLDAGSSPSSQGGSPGL